MSEKGENVAKLEASCLLLTFLGRIYTKLLARSNVVTIYSATPLQYLPSTPASQPSGVREGRKKKTVTRTWLLPHSTSKISLGCWVLVALSPVCPQEFWSFISSFTYNAAEENFVYFPRCCITFGESKLNMGKLLIKWQIKEHQRTFRLWQSVQDSFLKYFLRPPSLLSK